MIKRLFASANGALHISSTNGNVTMILMWKLIYANGKYHSVDLTP